MPNQSFKKEFDEDRVIFYSFIKTHDVI